MQSFREVVVVFLAAQNVSSFQMQSQIPQTKFLELQYTDLGISPKLKISRPLM